MTLTLKLDIDNAAFEWEGDDSLRRSDEIVRIVRRLADHLESTGYVGEGWRQSLQDMNGNRVGMAEVR
jgi:hypothetical protein